jgi:multiple antibiotic resistance protein
MPDLHHIVQAIVTVLAVINPVVCGSIFSTLTTKQTLAQRQRAAVKAALSILIILVASAPVGLKVLGIFGISLDVSGCRGDDHCIHGIRHAKRATYGCSSSAVGGRRGCGGVTCSAHHAAGPGTITAVVTLAAVHTSDGLALAAIAAAVIGAGVTFVVLLLAIQLGSHLGKKHAGHSHPSSWHPWEYSSCWWV